MKSIMKNMLVVWIVFLGLCVSSAVVVAESVVEDVIIDPAEPERLSTITITATITSDDEIDTVNLKIKECRGLPEGGDLCYTEETHEMTASGDDVYTIDYDLHYDDSGYFGYYFEIISNGESFETEGVNELIKAGSSNGDNGGGDDDENGSPGFELIAVLMAIFIGVILLKRKRSR